MQVDATHNAQIGFMIFDSWLKAVEKRLHSTPGGIASPLLDAAFQAFDAYAHTVETMNNAQIAALSSQIAGYSPNQAGNPSGGAQGLTTQQLAPFYALNVMG